MRAAVLGGGGFIGRHLVSHLESAGWTVDVADIQGRQAVDLRDFRYCNIFLGSHDYDHVYQLAADMGGAGYMFTGTNDARVLHNNVLINANVLEACKNHPPKKLFFSSSACVYPDIAGALREEQAYPADPDSAYGWEKLFSERMYLAYARNFGLNVRIARFHNIYGPDCTWDGGREKAPAAICRKIAEAPNGSEIELWGDGNQTRSFLYIDDCILGIRKIMDSDVTDPLNLGSTRLISIRELFLLALRISGKDLSVRWTPGPVGVRSRNSDNGLIREKLGWAPGDSLEHGMRETYEWIKGEVERAPYA